MKASQATFNTSFNKCKLMIKSCFLDIYIKPMQADPWDESSITVACNANMLIIATTKKNTPQIDLPPQTNVIQIMMMITRMTIALEYSYASSKVHPRLVLVLLLGFQNSSNFFFFLCMHPNLSFNKMNHLEYQCLFLTCYSSYLQTKLIHSLKCRNELNRSIT